MIAFISSVTLGIIVGFGPRLLLVITGAWTIVAIAIAALVVGHPDFPTWLLQLAAALLGYNLSIAASLLARARWRSF